MLKYITIDYAKLLWVIFASYLASKGYISWWTIILIALYGVEIKQSFNKKEKSLKSS